MKKLWLTCLAAAAVFPLQAQLFSHSAIGGAAVGAAAGALIGHGVAGKAGEGAAIGAGVGLLAGALSHESRSHQHGYHGGHYSPVYVGGYYRSGGYYAPRYHHHYGPRFGVSFYSYSRPYYVAPTYVQPVVTTPVVVEQPVVQPQAPAPQPQPQQVTIINNYYNSSTPMSSANSLFGR